MIELATLGVAASLPIVDKRFSPSRLKEVEAYAFGLIPDLQVNSLFVDQSDNSIIEISVVTSKNIRAKRYSPDGKMLDMASIPVLDFSSALLKYLPVPEDEVKQFAEKITKKPSPSKAATPAPQNTAPSDQDFARARNGQVMEIAKMVAYSVGVHVTEYEIRFATALHAMLGNDAAVDWLTQDYPGEEITGMDIYNSDGAGPAFDAAVAWGEDNHLFDDMINNVIVVNEDAIENPDQAEATENDDVVEGEIVDEETSEGTNS